MSHLAEMQEAVVDDRYAHRCHHRNITQGHDPDAAQQVLLRHRIEPGVSRLPDRPLIGHPLLHRGQLHPCRFLRWHAGALCCARQPERLVVATRKPHGWLAILKHELHEVVLSADIMPGDEADMIALAVRAKMHLIWRQIRDRLIPRLMLLMNGIANEIEHQSHEYSPYTKSDYKIIVHFIICRAQIP